MTSAQHAIAFDVSTGLGTICFGAALVSGDGSVFVALLGAGLFLIGICQIYFVTIKILKLMGVE